MSAFKLMTVHIIINATLQHLMNFKIKAIVSRRLAEKYELEPELLLANDSRDMTSGCVARIKNCEFRMPFTGTNPFLVPFEMLRFLSSREMSANVFGMEKRERTSH
ncbi:hypothetical protein AVEN_106411-1 [Araneus ventricosus]|uniref:Uncharacterized protein n=1 Tax=Araneus ventricosus TaxID=182803 RepID=A0A4Y2ATR3_ARAVE|nr:hypothetical protein AVEN_106411-1 [Araneus ventricosus]